jgi:hypothetical protein
MMAGWLVLMGYVWTSAGTWSSSRATIKTIGTKNIVTINHHRTNNDTGKKYASTHKINIMLIYPCIGQTEKEDMWLTSTTIATTTEPGVVVAGGGASATIYKGHPLKDSIVKVWSSYILHRLWFASQGSYTCHSGLTHSTPLR